MFVVITYEAGVCIVSGTFVTRKEAELWASNWYGDDHWSVELVHQVQSDCAMNSAPLHEEGDGC